MRYLTVKMDRGVGVGVGDYFGTSKANWVHVETYPSFQRDTYNYVPELRGSGVCLYSEIGFNLDFILFHLNPAQ